MLGFVGKSTIGGLSLTSVSFVMDDNEIPGVDTWVSLASMSLGTTLLVSCSDKTLENNVHDTSLVMESMSLEELYELKNLVNEKEKILSLSRKEL